MTDLLLRLRREKNRFARSPGVRPIPEISRENQSQRSAPPPSLGRQRRQPGSLPHRREGGGAGTGLAPAAPSGGADAGPPAGPRRGHLRPQPGRVRSILSEGPDVANPVTLRAFAVSIAFRRAREEIKRRRVRRVHEPTVRLLYGAPLTVEWNPADRQLLVHLHALVHGLGPMESRIYLLRAVQGCSVATICRLVHHAPSTVRRIFRRAEARLVRRMRNDPVMSTYLADGVEESSPLLAAGLAGRRSD